MSYWKGRKRGPQSPEHRAKTVINLRPGWNKGMKFPERSGSNCHLWTGNKVGYHGIHSWLRRYYGSPNFCEQCGEIGKHIGRKWNIEWALIKGREYVRKRENFIPLCHKCHAHYDDYLSKNIKKAQDSLKGKPSQKRIDLIGQQFGKLRVVSFAGKNKWGNLLFNCKCNCGKDSIVTSKNLRDGGTKSCGCMNSRNFMKGNKYRVGKIPWNKGMMA